MDEVVQRLKERIVEIPLGDPFFGSKRYTPVSLDMRYFHPIVAPEGDRTLCFLDGGNLEIVGAPNFRVDLVRLYFRKYRDNEPIEPLLLPPRIEFYSINYATMEKERIVYKTELIPVVEDWRDLLPKEDDLVFDSMDHTFTVGFRRARIERISRISRVFAEWKLAGLLAENELRTGDILVRDGSLQTFITNEKKYANHAYEQALRGNVIFTGLSKTSTLFTSTGLPLVSAIGALSEKTRFKNEAWYYYPVVLIENLDHRAEMSMVKLHSKSEYIFRFEILRDQAEQLIEEERDQIIAELANNARDISFPGYPYGLIETDRLGRIRRGERKIQETLFMSAASAHGAWDRIKGFIKAADAHRRLDGLVGE